MLERDYRPLISPKVEFIRGITPQAHSYGEPRLICHHEVSNFLIISAF
jgi:hypothetical protein